MNTVRAASQQATDFARTAAPREFAFSEREFDKIAERLKIEAGIDMPRSKEPLVYSRLAKRIRSLGLASFKEYVGLLDEPGTDEVDHLLVALTTNVTKFFREPHHFEDLGANIMPTLAATARARGRVRIWSAGCSSGEEPYSIGLTVLGALPEARTCDLRILATDINMKVVEHAKAGIYPAKNLAEAPKAEIERYFHKVDGDKLEAGDDLRAILRFRRLNLMADWPMKGSFDVIFCRNVTIYFDEETQARIWRRIAEKLTPGGKLYIGHSERVDGPALALLESDGVTAYRRREGRA